MRQNIHPCFFSPQKIHSLCYQEEHPATLRPSLALDEDESNKDRKITLKNGLGTMYHREHEAVISFRKFNKQKESEKYYQHIRYIDIS